MKFFTPKKPHTYIYTIPKKTQQKGSLSQFYLADIQNDLCVLQFKKEGGDPPTFWSPSEGGLYSAAATPV